VAWSGFATTWLNWQRQLDGVLPEPIRKFGRIAVIRQVGWLGVIAIILVVGTAAYFVSRPNGRAFAAAVYTVETGDVTIRISQRGELRALDSVTLSAQKDLPIIYLVPEGTQVEEGDLVVEFDAGKYENALEEAKVDLQVTQANLQKAEKEFESQGLKLEAGIARYEGDLHLAQLELDTVKNRPLPHELDRATNLLENAKLAFQNAKNKREFMPSLVEKGFVTKVSLEEAELSYLEAKANLSAAQFEYDLVVAGATPQELRIAEIGVEQAQVAVDKARAGMQSELESFGATVARERANVRRAEKLIGAAELKLARGTLFAPRAGIVVYAPAAAGSNEKVQLGMIPYEGQPVAYLPDLSKMVVDIEINEIDIGKVTEGSSVEVRLEAYPGEVFHGTVMEISSLAKVKSTPSGMSSGIKAFGVVVKIDAQDTRLKPGLTVLCDIVVDQRQDALSVPLRAVTTRRGEHVVFVNDAGKIKERKVVLGHSNEHIVIVEEGLRAGDRVLLGPPSS
jgi:HlyD family secretion protein